MAMAMAMAAPKSVILVLGGGADREARSVAAAWAQVNGPRRGPGPAARRVAPLWLSGPALTDDAVDVCERAGCAAKYLLVDYRALDTLSNFTTLVGLMREHAFEMVHIATSSRHMPRASAIAEIILPWYGLRCGSRIAVEPSPGEPQESFMMRWRDRLRAWVWVLFGFDFAAPLIGFIHPDRVRERDRRVKWFTYHGEACFGAV